jgi:hypothetical protein
MRASLLIALGTAVWLLAHGAAADPSARLSLADAASLAELAQKADAPPADADFRVSQMDPNGNEPDPNFYSFSGMTNGTEKMLGSYAVDRRTGDVWRYLGCTLVKSHPLESLQGRYRQRLRVSGWEVHRIEQGGGPAGSC